METTTGLQQVKEYIEEASPVITSFWNIYVEHIMRKALDGFLGHVSIGGGRQITSVCWRVTTLPYYQEQQMKRWYFPRTKTAIGLDKTWRTEEHKHSHKNNAVVFPIPTESETWAPAIVDRKKIHDFEMSRK